MFMCQITGHYSREGQKCNKVVVQTRAQTYKHWDNENEEEWFTHGTEIVREVNATEEGVRLWESWTEEERAAFVKGLN